MSAVDTRTVTDLFERHGIRTAITAQMLQIQELAVAISLHGQFSASSEYIGRTHILRVTVRDAEDDDGDQPLLVRQRVLLPNEGRPAPDASRELSQIIATLNRYLREGDAQ